MTQSISRLAPSSQISTTYTFLLKLASPKSLFLCGKNVENVRYSLQEKNEEVSLDRARDDLRKASWWRPLQQVAQQLQLATSSRNPHADPLFIYLYIHTT